MMTLAMCKAATISWALLYFGVTNDPRYQTPQPICFSEQWICQVGESAANLSFAYDGTSTQHKAACVQQPAMK